MASSTSGERAKDRRDSNTSFGFGFAIVNVEARDESRAVENVRISSRYFSKVKLFGSGEAATAHSPRRQPWGIVG
jgi:hypothetical protein